ncbi:MAG: hypothetical protein OES79_17060, partial [Planctomycetota bacterium]|nr:hypothetical protein [Planctomycetota bacterium]
MNKEISSYLLKLRQSHPFLATLSLYMRYQFTDRVSQFDTDGREARINSKYFESLDKQQRIGTLLHVTLHSALLHPVRRGLRIAEIWNVAADIVVNQIIAETSFEPPPNTAVEPRYAELSVEQVYTKLLSSASKAMTAAGNLSATTGASQDADEAQNSGSQGVANEAGTSEPRDAARKVEGAGPQDLDVGHDQKTRSPSQSPSAKPNQSDAGRGKPQNAATTQDSGADQNTSSGSLAGATEKEQRLTQA